MRSHGGGSGDAPLDRDWHPHTEGAGHGVGLLNDGAGQGTDLGMTSHFNQRRTGQHADGVEGDVSQQLDPHVHTYPGPDRAAQSRRLEGVGQPFAPVAGRAVRLADREPVALEVVDHTRLGDGGRGVNDAPNDSLGGDGGRDGPVRIQPLYPPPVQGAAMALEVPPGDAVLGRYYGRLRPQKRSQPWGDLRQTVGLDREEDEVDRAHLLVVVRCGGMGFEVALRAPHAHASRLHGSQVRPARYERDVAAGQAEPGAQVGAYGAGADDCEPHAGVPPAMTSATMRRCTLPVAVRGMASTM